MERPLVQEVENVVSSVFGFFSPQPLRTFYDVYVCGLNRWRHRIKFADALRTEGITISREIQIRRGLQSRFNPLDIDITTTGDANKHLLIRLLLPYGKSGPRGEARFESERRQRLNPIPFQTPNYRARVLDYLSSLSLKFDGKRNEDLLYEFVNTASGEVWSPSYFQRVVQESSDEVVRKYYYPLDLGGEVTLRQTVPTLSPIIRKEVEFVLGPDFLKGKKGEKKSKRLITLDEEDV